MKKIKLTNGQYALVDDQDYEWLSQWSWHPSCGYAGRNNGYGIKKTLMHRLILNAPDGVEVDHINRDRLDNQRANLRLASRSINQQNKGMQKNNTSGYKGVSWHKNCSRWVAYIQRDGKIQRLGTFKTIEEAARKRQEAEIV